MKTASVVLVELGGLMIFVAVMLITQQHNVRRGCYFIVAALFFLSLAALIGIVRS